MVSLNWSLSAHRLPLHAPLATAAGMISERRVWLLRCDADGATGWGEASPLPGFGGEDPESVAPTLSDLPTAPRAALARADAVAASQPCAAAAIRGALACRTAVARGAPLALQLSAALGARPAAGLRCNALLPSPDPDRALPLVAAGVTALKWKSCGDPRADAEDVRRLRASLGPSVRLRVDANGAWEVDGAIAFAEAVRDCDLDYVEQPLAPGREEELAALVPLQMRVGLDESLRSLADVERICAGTWAEVLVLKPQWLGGFPALRKAVSLARARHPRRVVVTSALDGAVGRAHALHAAAALGLDHEHHGLATGTLLAQDLGEDLPLEAGRMALPVGPGLGISIHA